MIGTVYGIEHTVFRNPQFPPTLIIATLSFSVWEGVAAHVQFFPARKARVATDSFINGAMVIEGTLLSFFLALWMTWIALSGLFRLMPRGSIGGKSCSR